MLIGYWKSSENKNKNIIHYWSEKEKLILENVVFNNETNRYDFKDFYLTFVEIKKNGRKYSLKFTSLYSSSKAKIKLLNNRQMVLKINCKEEVYNRIIE